MTTTTHSTATGVFTRVFLLITIVGVVQVISAVGQNESANSCASVNRMLTGNRACRCFDNPNTERYWVGCSRQKMPEIFAALSSLEGETHLEKLWLWDSLMPVVPRNFFAKVRPEKLVLEGSYVGGFMPGALTHMAKHLKVLDLKNNVINRISADLFAGLDNLQRLDLGGNRIGSVGGNSFGRLPALNYLSLSKNGLGEINSGAFKDLNALKHLNLANNRLTTLRRQMFIGLSHLEHLDLENNQIAQVEPDAFEDLKKLKSLNLGGNQIDSISISNLPSLERLFLNNNSFNDVSDVNLELLPSLMMLNLDQNSLTSLPSASFITTPTIQILSLTNNVIADLKVESLSALGGLRTLSLQNNSIDKIPSGLFAHLQRLRHLFLSQNHLTSLSENSFFGLRTLQVLSVAHNQLADVHLRAFADLTSLQRVYLNDNHLHYLDEGVFSFSQASLLAMDFSDNEWDCGCQLRWLLEYIEANPHRILNAEKVTCRSGQPSRNESLSRLQNNCSSQLGDAGESHSRWLIAIGITIGITAVLIVFCIALLYLQDRNFSWGLVNGPLKRVPSDMVDLLPNSVSGATHCPREV